MEKFSTLLNSKLCEFNYFLYYPSTLTEEYLVFYRGEVEGKKKVPLRIQGSCFLGETFEAPKCDCKSQIDLALKVFSSCESFIFIYIRIPTLSASLSCYRGSKEYTPAFTYEGIPGILHELKVGSVLLYTESNRKVAACKEYVEEFRSLPEIITQYNSDYLREKKTTPNRWKKSEDVTGEIILSKRDSRRILGLAVLSSFSQDDLTSLTRELSYLFNILEYRVPVSTQLPFICDKLYQEGADFLLVIGQVEKKFLVPISTLLMEMSVNYQIPIINGLYTREFDSKKYLEEIRQICTW